MVEDNNEEEIKEMIDEFRRNSEDNSYSQDNTQRISYLNPLKNPLKYGIGLTLGICGLLMVNNITTNTDAINKNTDAINKNAETITVNTSQISDNRNNLSSLEQSLEKQKQSTEQLENKIKKLKLDTNNFYNLPKQKDGRYYFEYKKDGENKQLSQPKDKIKITLESEINDYTGNHFSPANINVKAFYELTFRAFRDKKINKEETKNLINKYQEALTEKGDNPLPSNFNTITKQFNYALKYTSN